MAVPSAMTSAQETLTQPGTLRSGMWCPANRASVMIPIVFCASLVPWLVAMKAEETICSLRKARVHTPGVGAAQPPEECQHEQVARQEPGQGREHERQDHLLHDGRDVQGRCAAIGQGRADQPPDQGVRGRGRQPEVPGEQVPGDRAESALRLNAWQPLTISACTMPLPIVWATSVPEKRAHQVQHRGHEDGRPRRQHLGRHHGGDRVGRVVRAVGEVEDERDRDDHGQEEDGLRHFSARSPRSPWRAARCG